MAVKQFGSEILTSGDVNTYLANSGLVSVLPTTVTNGTLSNGTVTFSGVSSLTMNGVFTSAYTNYVIVARLYTTASDCFYQNTSGSTPAATAYNYSVMQAYPGVGVSISKTTNTSQFVFTSNSGGAFYGLVTADIFSPVPSEPTGLQMSHTRQDGSYANPASYIFSGNHQTAGSYDGFKLNVASGTMTGKIWVYGRRD